MKKVLSLAIVIVMIASLFALSVHAEGAGVVREGENGGNWIVDEAAGTYTCPDRVGWPSFGVWGLGNTDGKVSVTMNYTLSEKTAESTNMGGDGGFMFAVSDANGDGIIDENGDYYYLVDITCAEEHMIGIERNEATWGGWSVQQTIEYVAGDTFKVQAVYDPEEGSIQVYVNDELIIYWEDSNPVLEGTGYAICSKVTNSTYTDLVVALGDDVVLPDEEADDGDDDTDDADDDLPTTPGHDEPGNTTVPTIGPSTPDDGEKSEDEKKSSNILPIILIVCAAVAAVVIAIVIVLVTKKKKK